MGGFAPGLTDHLRDRRAVVTGARVGTPEEVADAVLYLASDASAFVTGSQFAIDGGLTAA
jgi:NAD(P)-dependent dehydrogenase (short-subunit alcohol dehydrogenase family)